jgi:hypothetical protein
MPSPDAAAASCVSSPVSAGASVDPESPDVLPPQAAREAAITEASRIAKSFFFILFPPLLFCTNIKISSS